MACKSKAYLGQFVSAFSYAAPPRENFINKRARAKNCIGKGRPYVGDPNIGGCGVTLKASEGFPRVTLYLRATPAGSSPFASRPVLLPADARSRWPSAKLHAITTRSRAASVSILFYYNDRIGSKTCPFVEPPGSARFLRTPTGEGTQPAPCFRSDNVRFPEAARSPHAPPRACAFPGREREAGGLASGGGGEA